MNVRSWVEQLFAPLAILISLIAYQEPNAVTWMKPHIPLMLGFIMFGMGMTLTLADFKNVLKQPILLFVGTALQYGIMPFVGYSLAMMMNMPPDLVAGFVLLGACPGGTASNVIAYLARGNVGLSVSLTLVSTALAVVCTPWLTWFYAQQQVDIDVYALMFNTCKIVLIPLMLGLSIRYFLNKWVRAVIEYLPILSVVIILAVIACVVGLNAEKIQQMTILVAVVVVLHNACGLAIGYGVAHLLQCSTADKRTLAIEVGMQNSGLAVALAVNTPGFGALAALPGALFSLWHNVSGSILASIWSRDSIKEKPLSNG